MVLYSARAPALRGSPWRRLISLLAEARAAGGRTLVVLDRDLQLADGDSLAALPTGVMLMPGNPGETTISLTALSDPIPRLFLMRPGATLGRFVLDVRDRVDSTVVDIPPGASKCNVDLAEIAGTGDDPRAFGVWVRGQRGAPTSDIDIRIARAHGLRTGVQIRDADHVQVRDSRFFDYGHKGVHAVATTLGTNTLSVIRCRFGAPANVRQSDGYARQPIGFNANDPRASMHGGTTITDCVMALSGEPHDGTPAGRRRRSRASADALSLHRATDFRIAGNRVTGSGELAINVSKGCERGDITGNVTEFDDIGAIGIGVLSDDNGASSGSIRNRDIVVVDNVCRRSVANALGQRPPGGQAALYAYASDNCALERNYLNRHESRVLPLRVAAISVAVSTNLSTCNNRTTGFAHEISEYTSRTDATPRDSGWRQRTDEKSCR